MTDLNFGLGVDTRGMEKGIKAMADFEKSVDRALASQEKASEKSARAFAKQGQAMNKALEDVRRLNQALRKSGAPPENISRNTRALNTLIKSMSRGEVGAIKFQRAQDRFTQSMNRSRASMSKFSSSAGTKKVGNLTKTLRDLESASVLAVGPLSGVGARIRALGAITTRSTLKIAGLLGAITGVAIGLSKLTTGAINAAKQFQAMEAAFLAGTGSIVIANIEMDFAAKRADDLGLNLSVLGKEYALLTASAAGTALQGEGVRKIFIGLTSAAAALKLNNEQLGGAFRAVTQIISKGNVQAEELRGQMAERIPGAFGIAAAAMGVTTRELDKMLKAGQLLATDLIPKLGDEMERRFGKQALNAANDLANVINRIDTRMLVFSRTLDKTVGISEGYTTVLITIANAIKSITDNMDKLFPAIGAVMGVLAVLVGPAILRGFATLVLWIARTTFGMGALNAILLANPFVRLVKVLGVLALAFAGGTVGAKLMSGAMEDQTTKVTPLIKGLDELIKRIKEQGGVSLKTAEQIAQAAAKEIAVKSKLLQQLQAELAAEEAIRNTTRRAGESTGGVFGSLIANLFGAKGKSSAELQKTRDHIASLLKQMRTMEKQLNTLAGIDPPALLGGGKENKDLDRAEKKIGKIIQNVRDLNFVLDQTEMGGLSALIDAEAVNKAEEVLAKLTPELRDKLLPALQAMVPGATNAAFALATLIVQQDGLSDAVKRTRTQLEGQTAALLSVTETIINLERRLEAAQKGSVAIKALEKQFALEKKVEKYRKALEKAGFAWDEINK
ncbi:hypothetical protein LCGC14_1314980, partial [marine sediment metagenome]